MDITFEISIADFLRFTTKHVNPWKKLNFVDLCSLKNKIREKKYLDNYYKRNDFSFYVNSLTNSKTC